MNLAYIRESFDTFFNKAGELSRQLAFAGIAIIWIFKTDEHTGIKIPGDLYTPLSLFCVGLLADLFQHLYGAVAWGIVLKICNKIHDNHQVKVSSVINIPTWFFFIFKVVSILLGHYCLLFFLLEKINFR